MQLGIGIYAKNSKNAVKLYCEAFGLTLGYHVLNDDGNYYHSELLKDGQPFLAVAEPSQVCPLDSTEPMQCNPVELGYTAEDRKDFDRIYALLKDGGTVLLEPCELPWSPLAATVMDRFGARWFISLPGHRPADDAILP